MHDPRHLSCSCGQTQWRIAPKADGTRSICHCRDCASFARHLERHDYLDNGGTELFQCLPADVTFDSGQEHLKLLRLSPTGLFRWYAGCCNTPIANTLPKNLPFAGMILPKGRKDFGRVKYVINGEQAPMPVKDRGVPGAVFSIFKRMALGMITGRRGSPFWQDAKTPAAEAYVLTKAERKAMQK